MDPLEILRSCTGFEWDNGNRDKNWRKHRVSWGEAEQVFFRQPLIALDEAHSGAEPRWHALGTTGQDRHLLIVFTVRSTLIRVISARDMSPGERKLYRSR